MAFIDSNFVDIICDFNHSDVQERMPCIVLYVMHFQMVALRHKSATGQICYDIIKAQNNIRTNSAPGGDISVNG